MHRVLCGFIEFMMSVSTAMVVCSFEEDIAHAAGGFGPANARRWMSAGPACSYECCDLVPCSFVRARFEMMEG